MTDHELDGLLGELAAEPMPADALARVQVAVARRIDQQRWWWRLGWAASFAAAALAWILWPAPPPVPDAPAIIVARIAVPEVRWPRVSLPMATPSGPKVLPEPPMVARFTTDDPEVVIYWFFDSKPPRGDAR